MTVTPPTLPRPQPWQDRGACAHHDLDLFFPTRGESLEPAKAICAVCPVREPCLEDALANVIRIGVRGGTGEKERRRIRHLRRCVKAGCTNGAHTHEADIINRPEWADERYESLWKSKRAPRRISFAKTFGVTPQR